MENIFDGLDSLGLNIVEDKELFPTEEAEISDHAISEIKRIEMANEILFDRKVECPICDMRFTSRGTRAGKIRLVDTDTDLRPIYDKMDPIPYDVLVCPTCGYASLAKTFKQVKSIKVQEFKNKVSKQYKAKKYPDIYSYDDAIERYKLALYGAMILESSQLEKAYLCLKLAWLYRGKRYSLADHLGDEIRDCYKGERLFIKKACSGFMIAADQESFPQLGFDALTVRYLIGELKRRQGLTKEAYEIMRKLKLSMAINQRLKLRVEKVMEIILETLEKEKQESM